MYCGRSACRAGSFWTANSARHGASPHRQSDRAKSDLLMMPFPAHVIAYHYVTHGHVLLQMANQEPVAIEAGEVVIFPTNDKHRLGSDLNVKAVNAKELVVPPASGG